MKTTQSLLLEAIENGQTKDQAEKSLASKMWGRLERALRSGFWFCQDCQTSCERVEDDHGQPAHCHRCGSHRIEWTAPVLVDDTQLIHPGEL